MLKKMKGSYFLIGMLSLFTFLLPKEVGAAVIPEGAKGVYKLTENMELTEKYVVEEGTTLTIDLNGFQLTGPSDSYALDNSGNLTIIDTGTTKGKIECPSTGSSCVRNLGTLAVDGVTINTEFVAIKNEEDAVATVDHSTLHSSFVLPSGSITGTFLNAGTATINNSTIISPDSNAVNATSGATANLKSSVTNINHSTLEGKKSIYARRSSDAPTSDTSTQTVNVNGGEIKGVITGTKAKGATINITGTVKASATDLNDVLSFSREGANVVLTTNLSNKDVTVNEGVTLTIPNGVTYTVSSNRKLAVKGNLNVEGTLNAAAHVIERNEYFGTLQRAVKLVGNGHNIVVLKDLVETTEIKPYAGDNIIIDLNGHSVTADITNPKRSVLTMKDGSNEQTGTFAGTITNQGKLIMESGNYMTVPVTEVGAITQLNGGTYPIDKVEDAIIPADKELKDNGDGTYSLQYKDADYTRVFEALNQANALNENKYTKESYGVLKQAMDAVIYGKKITEQQEVDAMAKNILDAIATLELKEEEKALSEVPNTGDSIGQSMILGLIGLVGFSVTAYYHKKQKN